jgi:creatinine amidohydrolase/Fe(II)-dependent formamide hydrolase-like protein
MRTFLTLLSLSFCMPHASAQVLQFAHLNTRQIENLDRLKTVIIVPGGILEEHGPYLPSGSDGIFNSRLAGDLARVIAARPGWKAVLLPSIPLGAGAANEMGHKYSFPGSCSVLPSTLRNILMDIGDQLGAQHFRWVFVIHGHGDPTHNRMIDQAGDYFHETYGGEMVNVFGYLWAMKLTDFRTPEQQRADGFPEHATMTETSLILSLQPRLVAPDYKTAPPHSGQSIKELEEIALTKNWPGYFGAPALASASLGRAIYTQWLKRSTELIDQVLSGGDYRRLPRYGDLYADDPADAAAASVNQRLESQHEAWLNKHRD